MWKYTVEVNGMACEMYEAHVNNTVHKAASCQKVSSSHGKGETTVIAENELDEQALRDVIIATGYEVQGITKTP